MLALPTGSSHWREAGGGLPTVLTPYLQIVADKHVLFAGTHGLGTGYLTLAYIVRLSLLRRVVLPLTNCLVRGITSIENSVLSA